MDPLQAQSGCICTQFVAGFLLLERVPGIIDCSHVPLHLSTVMWSDTSFVVESSCPLLVGCVPGRAGHLLTYPIRPQFHRVRASIRLGTERRVRHLCPILVTNCEPRMWSFGITSTPNHIIIFDNEEIVHRCIGQCLLHPAMDESVAAASRTRCTSIGMPRELTHSSRDASCAGATTRRHKRPSPISSGSS